jgi:RNA polymerase sigma-70 factor (ECF subfamily)
MRAMACDELVALLLERWPERIGDGSAVRTWDAEDPMTGDRALEDLGLAWGCALGAPDALERFAVEILEPVAQRMSARNDPHVIDELVQATRVKLLVGVPAGILHYRGRGTLLGFVRVVCSRLLIDTRRGVREHPQPDFSALIDGVHPDPELEYLQRHYGAALQIAIANAWRALPTHERFIVDLLVHHHLGVDEIATLYQIHRGTAVRRIASSRAALVSATHEELRKSLGVSDETLASILRLITTSLTWPTLD